MTVSTRITFEQSSGQFGPDANGVSFQTFLGVGGDQPATSSFSIGGSARASIPFVGRVEFARAELSGDVSFRMGLEVGFAASPGDITTVLPYDVTFVFPDEVAGGEVFRLDGSAVHDPGGALISTVSPGFAMGVNLVFELAADVGATFGAAGRNQSFTLADFDTSVSIPIISYNSVPDSEEADIAASDLAGVPIEGSSLVDAPGFDDLVGESTENLNGSFLGIDLADLIEVGTSTVIEAGNFEISEEGIALSIPAPGPGESLFKREADKDKLAEDSNTDNDDEEEENRVETEISFGNLADILLSVPAISNELQPLTSTPLSGDSDILSLTLDLDNFATAIFRSLTGSPLTLEAAASASAKLGPVSFGLDAEINLFDADLTLSVPVRQDILAQEAGFETKLSFLRADASGDSTGEAVFVTALAPRQTVFFNENATFQSDAIAEKLLELAAADGQVARDVDVFVDFDEGIPGAFTGETGSVSGGVVALAEGETEWKQVRTFTEETKYLARAQASLTSVSSAIPLTPRDGAIFKYVIYDQDSVVNADGVVDLGTIPTDRQFDLDFEPSEDGILELVQDFVETPVSTTGFVDGAPTLDLVFPAGIDALAVEVAHRASVDVDHSVGLRFQGDLGLSALAASFSASGSAFGIRKSIGVDFGPLWEQEIELFDAGIASLYDDSFQLTGSTFDADFSTGETLEDVQSYDFAVRNATPDDPSVIYIQDVVGAIVDGSASTGTTLSLATVEGVDPASLIDLSNTTGVNAFLANSTDAGAWTLISVENVIGTRGGDTLTGDDGDNQLSGGEGDDTLSGNGGNDLLEGGRGNDILVGDDIAGPAGDDTLSGGAGFDRLFVTRGNDQLDGGIAPAIGDTGLEPVDLDVLSFDLLAHAVDLNLTTGEITVDAGADLGTQSYSNFEGYAGSQVGDRLIGAATRDYFEGGAGNDTLMGEDVAGLDLAARAALTGENDRLYAGDDDDRLTGGPGADLLDGGAGDDTVDYSYAPTSVFVSLNSPVTLSEADAEPLRPTPGGPSVDFARIDGQGWRGWAQGDQLRDVENIDGSQFDDILFGDAGDNRLLGGEGDDRLAGRGGSDTLRGEDGDDVLWRALPDTLGDDRNAATVDAVAIPEVGDANVVLPVPDSVLTGLTAPARTVSVLDGGDDFDLVLTDGGAALSFDHEIALVSNGLSGTIIDVEVWTLRFAAEFETEVVGSLTDGTLEIRTRADPEPGDLYVTGVRAPSVGSTAGAFTEIDPVLASDWFDDPGAFGGPPDGATFGQVFASRPTQIDRNVTLERSLDSLIDIEGLSGSYGNDSLVGDDAANALFGGGGRDAISAMGGDDRLGFGEVQSAGDLFSFPGFPTTLVSTNLIESGPSLDDLVADYIAAGRDLAALDQVMDDLAAYEVTYFGGTTLTPLEEHSFLDGGAGSNTLDLRYDRGIRFLPGTSDATAQVNLGTVTSGAVRTGELVLGEAELNGLVFGTGGSTGSLSALLLDIDHVIGTSNTDGLTGNDADNRIEGGAGGDRIDGGIGNDTLSYANAAEAINFIVQDDDTFLVAAGDADGDQVRNIEFVVGSAHEDLMGTTLAVSLGASVVETSDLIEIDGAGGDDVLFAELSGIRISGGEGDDKLFLNNTDLGTGNTDLVGGTGIDVLIAGVDAALFSASIDYTGAAPEMRLTRDADGAEWNISGFEYIYDSSFGGPLVYLDNLDPVVGARSDLVLDEDPALPFSIAPEGVADLETEDGITIDILPGTGRVTYQPGGTGPQTDVTAGLVLTAAEAATLVFVPDQDFGLPVDSETLLFSTELNGDELTKAELEAAVLAAGTEGALRGEALAISFLYPGEDEADRQFRKIEIAPRAFDGASLDLPTVTDFDAAEITIETQVFAGQDQGATLNVLARLPVGYLGDEQLFEITAIPEHGRLYRFDSDSGEEILLQIGDRITNSADLELRTDGAILPAGVSVGFTPVETLSFAVSQVPDAGHVFNPNVDVLFELPEDSDADTQYVLLGVPEDGTLFQRDAETGARSALAPGDTVDADTLTRLSFRADPARNATERDAAAVQEVQQAQNRMTDLGAFGTGDPLPEIDKLGNDPAQDATAIRAVLVQKDRALPEFNGLRIDLAETGDTSVWDWETVVGNGTVAIDGVDTSLAAPVDWMQRGAADGGNGEIYGVLTYDVSFRLNTHDSFVSALNDVMGDGNQGFHLASIADAQENQFVFDVALAAGEFQDSFTGPLFGGQPLLGSDGTTSFRNGLAWDDGTSETFSAWRSDSFVNDTNAGTVFSPLTGGEDPDDPILLPTWDDGFGNGTFTNASILEVRSLTTEKNDLVTGSGADEAIRGGGGDDWLLGQGGDDTIEGGSGADILDGGEGDDLLTGGIGDDIFVVARDAGADTIVDFTLEDRLDLGALGLTSLSQLQIYTVVADNPDGVLDVNTVLSAYGSQITLVGFDHGATPLSIDNFYGLPVQLASVMPARDQLTLAVGDTLREDEIADLRYFGDLDVNGAVGAFELEVRDPWALPDDTTGLWATDPRPDDRDGIVTLGRDIVLTPQNDAPRAADDAFSLTLGSVLEGRDPLLKLTATDPESDPITFRLVSGPQAGVLIFDDDGGFLYTSDADFDIESLPEPGVDIFTYAVSDGTSEVVRTVTIDISPLQPARTVDPATTEREGGAPLLFGLETDDILIGSTEGDILLGDFGRDSLYGDEGADTLSGQQGDDSLDGGEGDDLIDGGTGTDTMTGGGGADVFVLNADPVLGPSVVLPSLSATGLVAFAPATTGSPPDVVTDFEPGVDLLDVSNWEVSSLSGLVIEAATGGGVLVSTPDGSFCALIQNTAGTLLPSDLSASDFTFFATLNDYLLGTDGPDPLDGEDGNDTIIGLGDDDTLTGGPDNDLILPGSGSDQADGGSGDDTVSFADQASDARVDLVAGTVTIGSDVNQISGFETVLTGAGADRLIGDKGANRLVSDGGNDFLYGDGLKPSMHPELAGSVYRMYIAALGREPDSAGFVHWIIDLFEGHTTLNYVAAQFVASAEFRATYGPLDDAGFVELLYRNVLGRDADAPGLASWLSALASGSTRADVLLGFSESPELKANSAVSSFFYIRNQTDTDWTGVVYRLYQAVLGREPDTDGFCYWVERLGDGADFKDEVVRGFMDSDEFRNINDELDPSEFVRLLYEHVLGRVPDEDEVRHWTERMTLSGAERETIVSNFSESPEFIRDTLDDFVAWMRGQGVDDVLDAGSGENVLVGGLFSDTFVFDAAQGGSHLVLDLEAWDTLEFRGFGYADDADVRARLSEAGGNVIFDDQGVTVVLAATALSDITDDMIL
ncbi:MAG: DUF4214 domain-containing protein [Rhodobacteraceae bacterium]|nr:DUF4214 domain-containing protein [Paracoccaceae bacterium]